ncbi:hypothetical protein H6F88_01515 [Oculatella sp. FACHB-28]|uniref:hypothetical protein n=1 Tax=Cyanophyceae TaxID=3028117 RepID=UPI001683BDFB|nr:MULTISPECIES: hypothetical protein [Cyanophyceae]MBD2054718.1 hypothetical protein [Oculatella sp. FACHB-28]MBD2066075.1 hypothetical protein [Leptolyngbya sp. FACHB-671]
MKVHHVDGNSANYQQNNLALLHRHRHDQLHRSLRDKHQTVEEPCEVQNLKHGSEDQRSRRRSAEFNSIAIQGRRYTGDRNLLSISTGEDSPTE